jgi:lipoprotein-anchoring transpeptidase ErfK/SrfK
MTPRRSLLIPGFLAAAAVILSGCATGSALVAPPVSSSVTSSATTSAPTSSDPTTPTASTSAPTSAPSSPVMKTVHVTSVEPDNSTYGVGMPVILHFSPAPTDATTFTHAVTVSVNGTPADGAWYWEQPTADEVASHTIEAHYRLRDYWPAHATIHVTLPIAGLSAGTGLVYSGALSSVTFKTGDAHVSTVDGAALRMTVTDDGKQVGPSGETTIPVSLGAAATPTFLGTKIVMQKGEQDPKTGTLRPNGTVMMNNPPLYTNDPVQWSVRVTQSGEYVHSAPWNGEIGAVSTSNGCTNLRRNDAIWFYNFSRIGDVVRYVNIPHNGGKMPFWDGYGDWNLTWQQWTGSTLPLKPL